MPDDTTIPVEKIQRYATLLRNRRIVQARAQRRYRKRRKEGACVVQFELSRQDIELLTAKINRDIDQAVATLWQRAIEALAKEA